MAEGWFIITWKGESRFEGRNMITWKGKQDWEEAGQYHQLEVEEQKQVSIIT
jgi:hypothetical protein